MKDMHSRWNKYYIPNYENQSKVYPIDREKIVDSQNDRDKAIEEIKQQMKKILARIEKLENN